MRRNSCNSYIPIISIKLKSVGGEWITFDAFVDSGASYSIFTAEIGEILGLNVEDGNKIYVTVGDGSLITVYLHEIEAKMRLFEDVFIELAALVLTDLGLMKPEGVQFHLPSLSASHQRQRRS